LDRAELTSTGSLCARSNPTACAANVKHCESYLDTSVFKAPDLGTYGNTGKGNWRGPSLWDVDTGLLKNFVPLRSHDNINFQFRGEFFNIFNHAQLADPNVTYSNAAFGTIRGTVGTNADYRIIQLALKMNF
jgi:hypothetical protein